MKPNGPVSAKIVVGGEGLGLPDADLVQKRAWEVAAIQEHEVPDVTDWEEAQREVHGKGDPVDDVGQLWAGDADGVGEQGVRAAQTRVHSEEATNLGEELVREGMEEAEHERMLLGHQRGESGEPPFEE